MRWFAVVALAAVLFTPAWAQEVRPERPGGPEVRQPVNGWKDDVYYENGEVKARLTPAGFRVDRSGRARVDGYLFTGWFDDVYYEDGRVRQRRGTSYVEYRPKNT